MNRMTMPAQFTRLAAAWALTVLKHAPAYRYGVGLAITSALMLSLENAAVGLAGVHTS